MGLPFSSFISGLRRLPLAQLPLIGLIQVGDYTCKPNESGSRSLSLA